MNATASRARIRDLEEEREARHRDICKVLDIPQTCSEQGVLAQIEALRGRCARAEDRQARLAADIKNLTASRDRWRTVATTVVRLLDAVTT